MQVVKDRLWTENTGVRDRVWGTQEAVGNKAGLTQSERKHLETSWIHVINIQ